MLSTTTSLASVYFSNLEQLAIAAGTTVTQASAHTIALLDNVMSQVTSKGEQWIMVTNIQLLTDPENALNRLVKVK